MHRLQQGQTISVSDRSQKKEKVFDLLIGDSHGWFEVRDVTTFDGKDGVIAARPDGTWYWVQKPRKRK